VQPLFYIKEPLPGTSTMSAGYPRPSSIETRSLLEEAPPSYHSTDDVSTPPSSPTEELVPPLPPANKVSNPDLAWMLAGLWSGVLLGAFDGTQPKFLLDFSGSHPRQAR
jgi:hypothetical protein